MAWKWTGAVTTTGTAKAGADYTLELPIESDGGGLPDIRWDATSVPGSLHQDRSDPRRLQGKIAADARGFYSLAYRIEGDPPTEGTFFLRIVPQTPAPSHAPAIPSHDPGATQPDDIPSAPARAEKQPAPDEDRGGGSVATLGRRYFVQVVRGGVRVRGLRSAVAAGRTTFIGKRSPAQVVDLDLKGQFDSDDSEKLCSRVQAQAYWSAGNTGIVVCNCGRNPLVAVSDGARIERDEVRSWRPGEQIEVPGGLILELIEEGAA